jgi:hypothetical protein
MTEQSILVLFVATAALILVLKSRRATTAVLFGLLWAAGKRFPEVPDQGWYLLFAFALTLRGGIAVLAALGFLCKSVKARIVGPNPKYVAPIGVDWPGYDAGGIRRVRRNALRR